MSKQKTLRQKMIIIALAFLLPVIITLIVMAVCGVVPFGNKSTMIWDSLLQYKDYYGYLWDVFHGNAGIEYSTGKALGGRMIGIVAYYLSSPLNLFIVFFSKAQIPQFMAFMILLRIGLCGITGYIYVDKRFKISVIPGLVLSSLYALMEYNVYNCRNVMWLDGVIILPLIALGVWKCVDKKKTGLLFTSVFVAIFCNWYTGYMVCLMSGILFIVEYLNANDFSIKKALKTEWKSIFRYIVTMLCGVLASLCILLPACMALVGGIATNNTVGLSRIVNMDITQFLSGFDVGAKVNAQDAPPIFTGTIVLIAVVAFFFNSAVKKKEKICMACLLALLCSCYCLRDLELVWTAFVRSTSYFFRFSFVLSFVMIMIAAREVQLWEKDQVSKKEVASAMGVVAVGLAFLYYIKKINSPRNIVIIYMAIFGIGIIVLLCGNNRKNVSKVVCFGVACLTAIEAGYNVYIDFSEYNNDARSFSDYTVAAENIVDSLNDTEKGSFFRYENDYNYLKTIGRDIATGESLLYGYNSIEHYSSAYDFNVDRFLAYMGYSDIPGEKLFLRETYWNSPMLLTDSLLSIKYVQLKSPASGYEKTDLKTQYAQVYKNKYALPLGYPVNDDIKKVSFGNDPFENQQNLLSAMLGEEVDVYENVDSEYIHTDKNGNEEWKLDVKKDGPVYVFVDGSKTHSSLYDNNCEVYVNGELIQNACHRFEINSMYIGEYKAGDQIDLVIKRKTNRDKKHTLYVSQLNTDVFEKAINILNTGYKTDLKISKNRITGEVDVDDDTEILLSIPYEDAWSAVVDGKEVKIDELADTFMGIKLDKGKHTVQMVYHTPGLRLGLIMSLAGFLIYAGVEIVKKKMKKQKNKTA